LLWLELKDKKLGVRFLRQYSVDKFVVDFYCPTVKLAVEIDGATHVTDEEVQYDKERQSKIEALNINFLRFTNEEVYDDRYNVLQKIKKFIEFKSKTPDYNFYTK
jgi:very-short-patch-repair endonuclease